MSVAAMEMNIIALSAFLSTTQVNLAGTQVDRSYRLFMTKTMNKGWREQKKNSPALHLLPNGSCMVGYIICVKYGWRGLTLYVQNNVDPPYTNCHPHSDPMSVPNCNTYGPNSKRRILRDDRMDDIWMRTYTRSTTNSEAAAKDREANV